MRFDLLNAACVALLTTACVEPADELGTNESNLICQDCETEPPPTEGGGGGGGGGLSITETMLDRCSGDVIVSRTFNAQFDLAMAGLAIKRADASSWTAWSELMPVSGGPLRWWCKSTIGNWIDPGTWRIKDLIAGVDCPGNWDATIASCDFNARIRITSSAQQGWTPEQSNCASPATRYVQARLGASRQLEIRCLQ